MLILETNMPLFYLFFNFFRKEHSLELKMIVAKSGSKMWSRLVWKTPIFLENLVYRSQLMSLNMRVALSPCELSAESGFALFISFAYAP